MMSLIAAAKQSGCVNSVTVALSPIRFGSLIRRCVCNLSEWIEAMLFVASLSSTIACRPNFRRWAI